LQQHAFVLFLGDFQRLGNLLRSVRSFIVDGRAGRPGRRVCAKNGSTQKSGQSPQRQTPDEQATGLHKLNLEQERNWGWTVWQTIAWQKTAGFLALRRNTALLLVALVLAGTGERLWLAFAPKYLETLGATILIIGLFDALQTLFGAIYLLPIFF